MNDVVALLVGAALVNNALAGAMRGLDRGTRSQDVGDAVVFGTYCALAMLLATALAWPLARALPIGFASAALVLVVAGVAALLAAATPRLWPPLAAITHGRWIALAANAAVIGAVLAALRPAHDYAAALILASGSGAGYTLVLAMFAAMRRRLDNPSVPAAFRGAPLELLTAGFMALAFLGFAGVAPAP